jgi:hypothetical protein
MTEPNAVVVGAVIAGFVAFVSLIISKEQSVSEFRQEWIDELRKDISAVVACVSGIHGDSITKHPGGRDSLWEAVRKDLFHLNELIARIRLRLNPKEHRKIEGLATLTVLSRLKELETIFESPERELHRLKGITESIVAETQTILKQNWTRVRSGESTFRLAKFITLLIAVAGFAWLFHIFKVVLR